ncbi:hypothetical protein [Eubacterium ventriosum]|jgi:hypothetical protein|uniref:hypothetical protein n=1 Tax=Eubacterium ventriosum TaxID=39496 RepID=UPI003AB12088
MKVNTHLKSHDYCLKDVCRIVNQKQQLLYIKNNVYPIDIYTSIDQRTGNDIIVMIFSRKESEELYRLWCNYELE